MPTPASGLTVTALAKGLDHPRWLFVLPNGDVLVAETNAPERPERKGPKTFVMNMVMKRAGAAVPSANRITLLRDADGDGVAEVRTEFLKGLNSPFGMAMIGNDLYVANTDAVVRFPYKEGATQITEAGTKVAGPSGRTAQSSLDQRAHREPRRHQALCVSRIEQQRRRERHREGGPARRDPRDRRRERAVACVRRRPAQSGRHGVPSGEQRTMGGGQ